MNLGHSNFSANSGEKYINQNFREKKKKKRKAIWLFQLITELTRILEGIYK